ncbi:MAG: putative inorganic carbon (HCO3(-)) transporter [Paraglaciecola sp.]
MSVLKTNTSFSLKKWLSKTFLQEKLNNPLGYVIGIAIALGLAFILTALPLKLGMMVILGLIGIPVVLYCFADLHFGIIVLLSMGFFLSLIGKFVNAPIGIAVDGMLLLLLFGLLVRLVKERDFSFVKSPITIFILIWIYYNFIEVLNPWADSRMAWIYTVRTVALYLAVYFVAAHAMSSLSKIKSILKSIIFLAFLSALYSLKQEFFGYSNAELTWLHSDSKRYELIYQWGRLRVFSFFSDPSTFGMLMAYMSVFCIVLIIWGKKNWQRIALAFATLCMFMGMAYAGSRTPFVLVPAGIMFFMLLTFKRETMIIGFGMILFIAAFSLKSTSNPIIFRIQSAFKPGKDGSVQVRMDNQSRVQPFIQSHPIGGGLGSTGVWGKRFTPNSWLASFAHDSLYVRIAVEAGYIGLIIYMLLIFAALRTGIYYFFRVKDPEIKSFYLAVTTVVFMLAVANYPQEAVTLPPTSMIFYVFLALLVRLKDFDENFRKEEEVLDLSMPVLGEK